MAKKSQIVNLLDNTFIYAKLSDEFYIVKYCRY